MSSCVAIEEPTCGQHSSGSTDAAHALGALGLTRMACSWGAGRGTGAFIGLVLNEFPAQWSCLEIRCFAPLG